MKNILGLLASREPSTSRIRRQLHKGKPFTPQPDWNQLRDQERLREIGGKDNDRAILAFLRHPDLPDRTVRYAVMERIREALDTYEQKNSVDHLEISTLQEVLEDPRLTAEEKVDTVRLAWVSKIGTMRGRTGFAETWASVRDRQDQVLEAAVQCGSREALIAAQFMRSLQSRGLNLHFLWDTIQVLLAPCEDDTLEVLWTLIEDALGAGETLSRDRLRELIDQAHLVLR